MGGDSGERVKIIEREVAITYGIETVGGDTRKAQLARDGVAVNTEAVAGEGAGTHGAGVGAFRGVLQTSEIARKGFGVREQKMRKKDRLRVLHVGHSGHRQVNICFGLFEKGAQQLEQV